jgi:hypothetical protein
MSTVFLDRDNRLHREAVAAECPHCGAIAHQTVQAHPDLARLRADKPAQIGVILQCDACHTPLFVRYRVRAWHEDRVELHPTPIDVERPAERFNYAYLPELVASCFREALGCYSAGLLQAFGVMCRLTTQAMLEDLGERSRLRVFDQVAEVRTLAGLDDATFAAIRGVLFEGDPGTTPPVPLTRLQAAVLVETMKDLLYQSYVRRAKLQQALRMRRFFAEPDNQRSAAS